MRNALRRRWPAPAAPPAPEEGDPHQQVQTYTRLAQAAHALSNVDDTALTADPTTNPRLVSERIAAADAEARAILTDQRDRAEDRQTRARLHRQARTGRAERALRAAEDRADAAAQALSTIETYEAADNPAASALRLHQADPRIRRALVATAIGGSAASAVGITAMAAAAGLDTWQVAASGVLAETVLTAPVVAILSFQGLIRAHHRGQSLGAAENVLNALWWAAATLLTISVATNTIGAVVYGTGLLGVVGLLGALVAAGSSLASWGTSTVIRAVIKSNTDAWNTSEWGEKRSTLERLAAGENIPDPDEMPIVAAPPPAPHLNLEEKEEPGTEKAEDTEDAPGFPGVATQALSEDQQRAALRLMASDPHLNPLMVDALANEALENTPVPDTPGAVSFDSAEGLAGGGITLTAEADDDPDEWIDVDGDDPANADASTTPRETGGGHDANSGDTATSTPEVDTDISRGGGRLDHLNAIRSETARRKLRVAIADLRAEGAEVTQSAVRRRTGMDLRTIRRHWDAEVGDEA